MSSLDAATLERLEADLASLIAVLAADEVGAQVPLAQLQAAASRAPGGPPISE
ncbi:hypothetical protein [Massilia litorea]|uniref:Uncharacterized protein n=1 Tax=Massilia litorea TaxID=2769491 RepID=A0A7L9U131_9BURK|nr:hypothetical protein [Massilia litorea]QOL48743.1 hypothetical protein LPB04_17530 [Massilia litorea]